MRELPKAYLPEDIETRWMHHWDAMGAFAGEHETGKEPCTIVLPPPNVTGILHLGHVLNATVQDILARRARQQGRAVLWVPGTDHAGIATQTKVEQALKKEGSSRRAIGREAFLQRACDWRDAHSGIIVKQLERLGASLDKRALVHTLDPDYSEAVLTAFVHLFRKGRIYRGRRMVHWCPKTQTALSDEEVHTEVRKGKLYYVRYPIVQRPESFIEIATTRPETLMGDVAVAVHPKDERYKDLIGLHVRRPFPEAELPIIADAAVDKSFGTGALKITPAHDKLDWEIGQRHKLEALEVIGPDARICCEELPELHGLDRFKAREAAAAKLEAMGLLIKVEPHESSLGISERGGVVVEPRPSAQWWLRYPRVAEARRALTEGHVRFYPEHWGKTYLHWLDKLQDWCLSRQLWWGHRIPVWYRKGLDKEQLTESDLQDASKVYVGLKPPADPENWEQDPDVLDTWASSWLWPFAVFGWPEFKAEGSLNGQLAKPAEHSANAPANAVAGDSGEGAGALKHPPNTPANADEQPTNADEQQPANADEQPTNADEQQPANADEQPTNADEQQPANADEQAINAAGQALANAAEAPESPEKQHSSSPDGQLARRAKFDFYYPTTTLVTGFDILFFWVARMIIAALEFLPAESSNAAKQRDCAANQGAKDAENSQSEPENSQYPASPNGSESPENPEFQPENSEFQPEDGELDSETIRANIPFKAVYFNGLIRDSKGRKMSKSLGNSPETKALIDAFGADGVRMGLLMMAPRGQDILFAEDRLKQGRHFCNKLYNACRFRQMQEPELFINDSAARTYSNEPAEPEALGEAFPADGSQPKVGETSSYRAHPNAANQAKFTHGGRGFGSHPNAANQANQANAFVPKSVLNLNKNTENVNKNPKNANFGTVLARENSEAEADHPNAANRPNASNEANPPDPSNLSDPTNPSDPSNLTDPTNSFDPTNPSDPSTFGGDTSNPTNPTDASNLSGGGFASSAFGSAAPEAGGEASNPSSTSNPPEAPDPTNPPEAPDPTNPPDASDPSNLTDPTNSSDPTNPSDPSTFGGDTFDPTNPSDPSTFGGDTSEASSTSESSTFGGDASNPSNLTDPTNPTNPPAPPAASEPRELETLFASLKVEQLDCIDFTMLSALLEAEGQVEAQLRVYNFNAAQQILYKLFWTDYCDWYLEVAKARGLRRELRSTTLAMQDICLWHMLVLLHPFIPFITEELLHQLRFLSSKQLAQQHSASQFKTLLENLKHQGARLQPEAERSDGELRAFVAAARSLKADCGLPAAKDLHLFYDPNHPQAEALLSTQADTLKNLIGLASLEQSGPQPDLPAMVSDAATLYLKPPHPSCPKTELKRIAKELCALEAPMARVAAQLDNPKFLEHANPSHVAAARASLEQKKRKQQSLQRLELRLQSLRN